MKNQLLKKIFLNNQRQLISQKIVKWYLNHGRHDLPWRQKISPYRIWISEIMLQQTQVKTAIPYFKNFIKKYPTQKKLSEATEDQILALWSGLGFYRRARNIFKTKEIIKELNLTMQIIIKNAEEEYQRLINIGSKRQANRKLNTPATTRPMGPKRQ